MKMTHVYKMSKKSLSYSALVLTGVTIFVCWLSLYLLGAYAFVLSLGDIVHENISYAEAQKLTPFKICLPTYLPTSVNSNPQITYLDDDGRGEITITFDYFNVENQVPVVQIQQRKVSASREFLPLENTRIEVRDVLAWQVGFDKALDLLDVVHSESTLIEEFSENRGMVEVLEPRELKGSSVFWVHSAVLYRVFTRLSSEEVIKISKDLDDCRP